MIKYLIFFFLASSFLYSESGNDYVSAEIISDHKSVKTSDEFWVGVKFILKPDWHIYWLNPGDSGLPTEIEWNLPEGYEILETIYPAPEKIEFSGMANFGYHKETLIMTKLKSVKRMKNGAYNFTAKVKWLVCKEKCIPGNIELSSIINVNSKTVKSDQYEYFQKYINDLPLNKSEWAFRAQVHGDRIFLDLKKPEWAKEQITKVEFFPIEMGYFINAQEPKIEETNFGYRIFLNLDNFRETNPEEVKGILKINSSWLKSEVNKSININIPVSNY